MSFDPSKVDLSLVEPALRPEVLRRVTVLEEFTRSRVSTGHITSKPIC